MSERRKDNKGRVLQDNFYQRKNGTYEYKYSINGKRKSIYAADLQTLKNKVQKLKKDIEYGVEVFENISLDNWFIKWMQEYRKGVIRDTTYANNMRMWKNHISKDQISDMRVQDIKPIDIQTVFNKLQKKLSYSSVKMIKSMIFGCLECAKQNKLIALNPCKDTILKNYSESKEKNIFETVEIQNDFLQFIESNNLYGVYMPLFATMALTGARIGEILGLTWEDIDFTNLEININKTLHYNDINDGKGTHFFITKPKTKASAASVPMMKNLKNYLIRQKSYQFENGLINKCTIDDVKGFIFTTKTGKPYTIANINRIILLVIDAYNKFERANAEKENRDATLVSRMSSHSFRHNMATRLCESCDDVKAIQGILRHESVDTTLNIYAKVTNTGKNKAIEQLENTLSISM